ncbi:hypothetical protein AUJ83_04010 [Candidatus Woesearchaeota archaeon CG1_02_33_12]|nr:MAG: hypothetical protein AUJ83_04010 [Candidatus Woesearchaeota archaeon CG1_02_33_12]
MALEETEAQRKCIKQFVLNVERNVKCPLSHQKTDQSTVETVMESTRNSKFIFFDSFLDTIFLFYFFKYKL